MYTIAFAGGGTAGHVMPNLAVIAALGGGYKTVYIGGNGMEKDLCVARGIPFYTIDTVKLRRDAFIKNIAVPFKLRACVKSAKKALDEIKPDLIFSKGGYAALPVVLAAKDVPVVCHESDFSPGLATKLSKRKATRILCAFEPCAEKLKRAEYCGTPLDPKLYEKRDRKSALEKYGLDGKKPVLTVMGGSSGATALNECTAAALPELLKLFDIIHITGKNKRGADATDGYKAVEFENDMPTLYACTDIALTRAGANALAECIALKIPAVAVPLEKASRGDQVQNAMYYAGKNALKVLREADMTPSSLAETLADTYNRKSTYISGMSAIDVDGTQKICDIIKEYLK
ncbi:MAG: UDP-N-acetylglucosamine--N-acetylmuramyl-(pentapeptide) pyrophosphoryl-undecaprenol N-acetylglucosamine transferase [Roseburia sp.]|nr:UDP-N-acetylglucosamine--N-acetylmuramyl-(pentapeptide) pyrophosphoryl-undecaprenol N-acetylglucosamine transferase [Roseburia sp.]